MILIWSSEEIIRVVLDDFLEEGPETVSFISHFYYGKYIEEIYIEKL